MRFTNFGLLPFVDYILVVNFLVLSEDYSKMVFLHENRYIEFHNQGGFYYKVLRSHLIAFVETGIFRPAFLAAVAIWRIILRAAIFSWWARGLKIFRW